MSQSTNQLKQRYLNTISRNSVIKAAEYVSGNWMSGDEIERSGRKSGEGEGNEVGASVHKSGSNQALIPAPLLHK